MLLLSITNVKLDGIVFAGLHDLDKNMIAFWNVRQYIEFFNRKSGVFSFSNGTRVLFENYFKFWIWNIYFM